MKSTEEITFAVQKVLKVYHSIYLECVFL